MKRLAGAALSFALLCGFGDRSASEGAAELLQARQKDDAAVIAKDSDWLGDQAAARLSNTRDVALWHERAQVRYLDAAKAYRCLGDNEASLAVARKCVDKLAILPGGGARCEALVQPNSSEAAVVAERRTAGEATIRRNFHSPAWTQALDSRDGVAAQARDNEVFRTLQDLPTYDRSPDGRPMTPHVTAQTPSTMSLCLWAAQ